MEPRDSLKDAWQLMDDEVERMRQEMKEMANDLRNMGVGWSDWEPHTVGVIPIRLNGRWYWKGDTVYRKEKMRWLTGSGTYIYGDEFDVLKENHE